MTASESNLIAEQTAEAAPETPPVGPDIGSDGVTEPDGSAWTVTPVLETGESEPADGPIPDLVPGPDDLPVVGGMTDDVDVREARFDQSRSGGLQGGGSETVSPGDVDGGLPRASDEGREVGGAYRGFGQRELAGHNVPQPDLSDAMRSPVAAAGNVAETEPPVADSAYPQAVGPEGALSMGGEMTRDPGSGQTAPFGKTGRIPAVREKGPDTVDRETSGGEGAGTRRLWLPLMVTLLALFASGGLNVYLGWIMWDTHHRYQRLVAQLHRADPEVSLS